MTRKVHIHSEDYLRIQDYTQVGWREVRRFGDLVEMELTEPAQLKQKALGWLEKTMLTISQVLNKEIKWKP